MGKQEGGASTMSEEKSEHKHWIVYPIGSKPKWGLAVLLGIQQYLTMFGATVLIPFIVGGAMGLPPEELALLISTIFFTSGLCTLIQQSPLGNKLPVIQGGTFSFLGPTFAILGLVHGRKICNRCRHSTLAGQNPDGFRRHHGRICCGNRSGLHGHHGSGPKNHQPHRHRPHHRHDRACAF